VAPIGDGAGYRYYNDGANAQQHKLMADAETLAAVAARCRLATAGHPSRIFGELNGGYA